jgi:adenylate cyclase, class 2
MSIEIEYKFALQVSIPVFVQLLADCGYTLGPRDYEKTVMYDNPSQLMQTTDGRVRLRQSGDRYSLSYKKPLPSQPGEPKREIEHETGVGDFVIIDRILRAMDFAPTSSYEKYRTKVNEGAVQITIDEYPYQTFVEIEGDEDKIAAVAKQLGFDVNDHLSLPADTLFNQWRVVRGLPERMHLSFDSYDK